MYIDGPCGYSKFWIKSLAFQKYKNDPYGLQFISHLVLNFCQKYTDGPPCTFGKLGTKSKILVNHRDHPCTLLIIL
ncbi:hypothetical protein Hanom_Chr02g00176231 [Helianthus anomalus]